MQKDKQSREDFATECDRRSFLKQSSLMAAFAMAGPVLSKAAEKEKQLLAFVEQFPLTIEVNGVSHALTVEPRMTLLDLLREKLQLTGTKKGCDYGQCGACTVHINGERALSCLSLAIMQSGKKITTIEGIGTPEALHPMQESFIKHDGFQCGYCTPGQIMSSISCIREGHAASRASIAEYMSGNICRCGCYTNICNAIEEVQKSGKQL